MSDQWDDTEWQRDDQLLLADAFEEIELFERIGTALNNAALNRVHVLWDRLKSMSDQGEPMSPAAYRELLRLMDQLERTMRRG